MNSNDIARPRAFAIAWQTAAPWRPLALAPVRRHHRRRRQRRRRRHRRRRRAAFIIFIHRGYHG